MTEIVPDFRAYCKQDKPLSYNDLGQDYPIKLPTRMREEPKEGIIPVAFEADALHAAYATVSECEVLVTLNLKHLANEWAARKLNAVNVREGYPPVSIRTPEEVVRYEE
jgi:hypothetical protein